MTVETLYHIRRLDEKRVAVSKFEDGDLGQVYTIENSQCDCPGCLYHKTECKHLKILKVWKGLNEGPYNFSVNKKGIVTPHKLCDPNATEE